jgi:hypothetical protein
MIPMLTYQGVLATNAHKYTRVPLLVCVHVQVIIVHVCYRQVHASVRVNNGTSIRTDHWSMHKGH